MSANMISVLNRLDPGSPPCGGGAMAIICSVFKSTSSVDLGSHLLQEFRLPWCVPVLQDGLSCHLDQPKIERKIVDCRKLQCQDLTRLEQMPQVRPREIAARVARAMRIYLRKIIGVLGIAQVEPPM